MVLGIMSSWLEGVLMLLIFFFILAKVIQLVLTGVIGSRAGVRKFATGIAQLLKGLFELAVPLLKLLWVIIKWLALTILKGLQFLFDVFAELFRRVYDRRSG